MIIAIKSLVLGFIMLYTINVHGQVHTLRDSVKNLDTLLSIKYREVQMNNYDYEIFMSNQQKKIYIDHHSNSQNLFWLVATIVISGLVFSGIQFYISLKAHEHKRDVAKNIIANATENTLSSTLKLSKDGIEVTSSILGVIILAMSIIFLSLYLKIVYPVNDEGESSDQTNNTEAEAKSIPPVGKIKGDTVSAARVAGDTIPRNKK